MNTYVNDNVRGTHSVPSPVSQTRPTMWTGQIAPVILSSFSSQEGISKRMAFRIIVRPMKARWQKGWRWRILTDLLGKAPSISSAEMWIKNQGLDIQRPDCVWKTAEALWLVWGRHHGGAPRLVDLPQPLKGKMVCVYAGEEGQTQLSQGPSRSLY